MKNLRPDDLIPGKFYVFVYRNNSVKWPLFIQRLTPGDIDDKPNSYLHPLEPFVFLERLPSLYRFVDEDELYDYKILTTKGNVLWLNLHSKDLAVARIGFFEINEDNNEFI